MKKRLDKEVKICYNKSRCENNYCNLTVFEPLAQAAEHLPFKQGVPGSIPGWLTKGVLDKPFFYDGGFAVMVLFGTK